MSRIVAILGGGDWNDASCDHLEIPDNLDISEQHRQWRRWYSTEYLTSPQDKHGTLKVKYVCFVDWLKKFGATDAEIEEFYDL